MPLVDDTQHQICQLAGQGVDRFDRRIVMPPETKHKRWCLDRLVAAQSHLRANSLYTKMACAPHL